MNEEKLEIILIQKKDEFLSFPREDSRILAYKKIFTILKEAFLISGIPLEGINLKYDKNCFIFFEKDEVFYGVLAKEEIEIDKIFEIIDKKIGVKKIKEEKRVITPVPEEIKVSPETFDRIKEILKEYLGAFSETIFENQLKDTRISPHDATLTKTKKFITNLQNAASMIIGPLKAREMGNKMLKLLQ
jgi:cell division protein FtsI/penicillin-binding protein 2